MGHDEAMGWPFVAVIDGKNQVHYVGGQLTNADDIVSFLQRVSVGQVEAHGDGKGILASAMKLFEKFLGPVVQMFSDYPVAAMMTMGAMMLACMFLWK